MAQHCLTLDEFNKFWCILPDDNQTLETCAVSLLKQFTQLKICKTATKALLQQC